MSAKNDAVTRSNGLKRANISEHERTHADGINAQQLHSRKPKIAPKTSKAYWVNKVKKPPSSAGGESPHYGIQLAHQGRRVRFPLHSADKEVAAAKAAKVWTMLKTQGWDATLAEFKPATVPTKTAATVGALIAASVRLSSARPESLDTYTKALRRIAAGVTGIDNGRKYDFKRGSAEWRAKVDDVPLERLSPANVLSWKNGYLKAAKSPDERNRASVTLNSLLRNSKALVGKKVLPFISQELELPTPLWFEGVAAEPEPTLRYRSKIDAAEIITAARKELAEADPEAFKLLLLTLVCGLRRSEADNLLWSQVDLKRKIMVIEDNEFKRLKSKDSAGEIGLDDELAALFRQFRDDASGPFVLETPKRVRKAKDTHISRGYRCDSTQQRLLHWLKAHGVPGHRPIHTLRKEIGSVIASRDGIFKASRYLRHSDIRITSRLYADTKTPVTAGLGALFAPTRDALPHRS